MLEPGVIDLNLDDLSDEELAALVEDARRELAGRQTRGAIVRDLESAVDRVVGTNLELMGDGWESGRVAWDGDTVSVAVLSAEEYEASDLPEPAPVEEEAAPARDWVAGVTVAAGDRVRYQGTVYTVVQGHVTAAHWLPDSLPSLYRRG